MVLTAGAVVSWLIDRGWPRDLDCFAVRDGSCICSIGGPPQYAHCCDPTFGAGDWPPRGEAVSALIHTLWTTKDVRKSREVLGFPSEVALFVGESLVGLE